MRAAVVTKPGGPEVFEVVEREDPMPGPDEVLIAVKASALNAAKRWVPCSCRYRAGYSRFGDGRGSY